VNFFAEFKNVCALKLIFYGWSCRLWDQFSDNPIR